MKAIHLWRCQLGQQFTEFLAESKIWFDLFVCLCVQVRQVDRVAYLAGQQVTSNDFGYFQTTFFLGFMRAGTQMRSQNNSRMSPERMVGRQRFGSEDIQ